MKSNTYQEFLVPLSFAIDRIQSSIKRLFFRIFIRKLPTLSVKLYKYIGRQSRQETERFLRADSFTPDNRKVSIVEDKETLARTGGLSASKKVGFFRRACQRNTAKAVSSSFSHPRRSIQKFSSFGEHSDHQNALVPLDHNENDTDDDLKQEDEVINTFRIQKSRRQQFKNQFLQAERAEIFKLIGKSITGLAVNSLKLSKKKQEKRHQMDHYVSMEVSARDQQNTPQENTKRVLQKTAKVLQEKTDRTANSRLLAPFSVSNNKFEELKHDEKVFLLNVPNDLKLSPGVTLRDNQKHLCPDYGFSSGASRKKLQFLKNQETNPIKIKMSELMSFKKITTSTNLPYCSSMKTVKDIPKQGTESKISIDSRQFLDEQNPSKKLIKITNHKVYELLLAENQQEEKNLKKVKIKPRKEGKVRFDPESIL